MGCSLRGYYAGTKWDIRNELGVRKYGEAKVIIFK